MVLGQRWSYELTWGWELHFLVNTSHLPTCSPFCDQSRFVSFQTNYQLRSPGWEYHLSHQHGRGPWGDGESLCSILSLIYWLLIFCWPRKFISKVSDKPSIWSWLFFKEYLPIKMDLSESPSLPLWGIQFVPFKDKIHHNLTLSKLLYSMVFICITITLIIYSQIL